MPQSWAQVIEEEFTKSTLHTRRPIRARSRKEDEHGN